MLIQRTLALEGRITVWLVSSLTREDLTNKENMWFLVCSEAVEYILVKTSCTVILPPTLRVLLFRHMPSRKQMILTDNV